VRTRNMVSLRKFSLVDGEAEREFLLSFPVKENGFGRPGDDLDLNVEENFTKLIKDHLDRENGINLKKDYVPQTTFWILSDGELAGIGKVRHYLNDVLRKESSSIGMGLAPQFRGRGVGTEALKLLIEFARSWGQDKILLTNDEDNWASRKIVEKNGGILEKVENGTSFYWI
jgi:Predicted acetyltransferase